jgi:hypothetical protein
MSWEWVASLLYTVPITNNQQVLSVFIFFFNNRGLKDFVQIFNFLKTKETPHTHTHTHTTAPFFNISKFWHSRINIQDALLRETRCSLFFWPEISPKCEISKQIWQNISPHLDSDFSLINTFKTSFLTI